MSDREQKAQQLGGRSKRPARVDEGRKIVVRVKPKEFERIRSDAAGLTVSTYVRKRLLGGRAHSRDVYDQIAALHAVGRLLSGHLEKPGTPGLTATKALADLRAAILRLVPALPVLEADDGPDE